MKFSSFLSIAAVVAIFTGCGGGGGSTSTAVTGSFIDSAVQGLDYNCSSGGSGVTDVNGNFTCNTGDTVTFSINGYQIGTVAAQTTITPATLFPNNSAAMINLAQLLQTLDSDGNPNNGITLDSTSQEVQALSSSTDVNLSQTDFDSAMTSYIGKTLVDETNATAHLNLSIQNINNGAGETTSDSIVSIMNHVNQNMLTVEDFSTISYSGYASYADFVNAGGSVSVKYYDASKTCSQYSGAAYCNTQDFANTAVSGTGSCVVLINYPGISNLTTTNTNSTVTDTNTTTTSSTSTDTNTTTTTTTTPETNTTTTTTTTTSSGTDITYSDYTSTYKAFMPNLRADNIYFVGSDSSVLATYFSSMTAQPRVADILYTIGGSPSYSYETTQYTYTSTTMHQVWSMSNGATNDYGTMNIVEANNVFAYSDWNNDPLSVKFTEPITSDALHQMYLDEGLDITFDSNDKAQFMFQHYTSATTDYMRLVVNESAYLKIKAAFDATIAP